jgi:hypothetical protein
MGLKEIVAINSLPTIIENLARIKEQREELGRKTAFTVEDWEVSSQLHRIQARADAAKQEVEDRFPFMHTQALVSLWSYAEDCLYGTLVNWIANEPTALQKDHVEDKVLKIKIDLAMYETLDRMGRAEYLVDQLKPVSQRGVNQFENLLEAFKFKGNVEKDVKDTIYEMQQVRNVVAHRSGLADKKLLDTCPWLGDKYQIGDPVQVTFEDFDRYSAAIKSYIRTVIDRFSRRWFELYPTGLE